MHRLTHNFRFSHCGRIQSRSSPSHLQWQPGKIDNTPVATVAAQIVGCPHKDAINWTWLDAQGAEHAFGVVYGKTRDLESLAFLNTLLADVDAVHRTSFRTPLARYAGGQVKSVKATIPRRNRNWFFRILVLFGKGSPTVFVGRYPIPQCNPHSVGDRPYCQTDIAEPVPHLQGNLTLVSKRISREFRPTTEH